MEKPSREIAVLYHTTTFFQIWYEISTQLSIEHGYDQTSSNGNTETIIPISSHDVPLNGLITECFK